MARKDKQHLRRQLQVARSTHNSIIQRAKVLPPPGMLNNEQGKASLTIHQSAESELQEIYKPMYQNQLMSPT